MTSPMISQTKKRSQVSSGRLSINTRQQTMEIPGSSGTQGTRKPRGRSGCFLRSTMTPAETRIKANNVPMFDMPTAKPATQVLTYGVLKRGCTREKTSGNKRSRDIANQKRACPY
jgi:hypothetical protein